MKNHRKGLACGCKLALWLRLFGILFFPASPHTAVISCSFSCFLFTTINCRFLYCLSARVENKHSPRLSCKMLRAFWNWVFFDIFASPSLAGSEYYDFITDMAFFLLFPFHFSLSCRLMPFDNILLLSIILLEFGENK